MTGGYLKEPALFLEISNSAASGTTTVLLKPQYLSGVVSRAAHGVGLELVRGHRFHHLHPSWAG